MCDIASAPLPAQWLGPLHGSQLLRPAHPLPVPCGCSDTHLSLKTNGMTERTSLPTYRHGEATFKGCRNFY
ncbi:hypothetical protein EYF80_056681 [Liparis tanakae]|uniref:Uncharacterized protein n=1 Tax=Liparis tanakae TaxID=230148 RepID=A0A4Z2EWG6_9TELE|nr:hypothetical protein EYF80_056681 [Liparis tanakae]